MVDRLITAYRAQIYDWTLADWKRFCSEQKQFCSIFCVVSFLIVVGIAASIICKNLAFALLAFLLELIAVAFADRYTVKQHQIALANRKNRLYETISFLQNTIPDIDLYHQGQIDELITRLSARIETRAPFKNFLSSAKGFATTIILPIITYIAGAYSSQLQQLDIMIAITYGVSIIISLASLQLIATTLLDILHPLMYKNYDAAVSLREDLMDLKLLYFSKN